MCSSNHPNHPLVEQLKKNNVQHLHFSTVSSHQNANTVVIWQDMLSSYTRDMPDWKKTLLMKITGLDQKQNCSVQLHTKLIRTSEFLECLVEKEEKQLADVTKDFLLKNHNFVNKQKYKCL